MSTWEAQHLGNQDVEGHCVIILSPGRQGSKAPGLTMVHVFTSGRTRTKASDTAAERHTRDTGRQACRVWLGTMTYDIGASRPSCVCVCVMSKQCCSVCGAGRSMDGCTYVCMYVGEEAHPGEASKRGWASPQAGRPSRQDEQACGGDYHKPPTGRETR